MPAFLFIGALLDEVFALPLHLQPFHAAGFVLVAGGAVLCCLRPDPVLSSRAAARPTAK